MKYNGPGRLILLLVLPAVGCAGSRSSIRNHEVPAKAHARDIIKDYYPLRIGNTWTYEVNTLGEKTEQVITVDRKDGKFFHLSGGAGGLIYRDGYGIRDMHRYILRFPVKLGGNWESILSPDSIEYYEVTAVGKKVSVPAGSFDGCVEVLSKHSIDKTKTLVNRMTFAPGVGLVKIETELHQQGKNPVPQVVLRLARYKVAPSELPKVVKGK
ncbi:MAG: hypothetical protein GXP49_08780 [Deltaproteobacteria bacterium]|nr:hypothetical protein [Deltaproteobacteria bacterium]